MKHLRPEIVLGIVGLLAFAGLVALHPQSVKADEEGSASGRSFLTTVNDSNGNFASRGAGKEVRHFSSAVTFHAAHT